VPRTLDEGQRRRLVAAQRVLSHAITTPTAPDDVVAAQRAGYAALGVDPRDARALAASDPRRILVYRGLVRHTLRDVLHKEMPRAMARLGAERFEHDTRRWIETELPRSQILRDVAYEMCAWATPLWRAERDVPAHVVELARYELLEFDVYTAQRYTAQRHTAQRHTAQRHTAQRSSGEVERDELSADHGVAFDTTMRLGRFDFAVHRLVEDVDDRTVPDAGRFDLLCYRDADGAFRRMELTPLAGEILRRLWRDGAALAAAVADACRACGRAVDQQVVDGTGVVLEDLASRGVLLGRRDGDPPPLPSPHARWLLDGA
jgi:hypothetical protein